MYIVVLFALRFLLFFCCIQNNILFGVNSEPPSLPSFTRISSDICIPFHNTFLPQIFLLLLPCHALLYISSIQCICCICLTFPLATSQIDTTLHNTTVVQNSQHPSFGVLLRSRITHTEDIQEGPSPVGSFRRWKPEVAGCQWSLCEYSPYSVFRIHSSPFMDARGNRLKAFKH